MNSVTALLLALMLVCQWPAVLLAACPDAPFSTQQPEQTADFLLASYRSIELYRAADPLLEERMADNIVTWQLELGGWGKDNELEYLNPWSSPSLKSRWLSHGRAGVPLATFDNNATTIELRFLAHVYKQLHKPSYRAAVNRAVAFILLAQQRGGCWPQVFPRRSGLEVDVTKSFQEPSSEYSNLATFNDDVIIKALVVLDDILQRYPPFDTDIIDAALIPAITVARDQGMHCILSTQLVDASGTRSVWPQQLDPETLAPRPGRTFEPAAKAGGESAGIVTYLLTRRRRSDLEQQALTAALLWLDRTRADGIRYNQYTLNSYTPDPGFVMWHRYYDLNLDRPVFSGRDSIPRSDINQIEEERHLSYQWGGGFNQKVLSLAHALGCIPAGRPMPLPAPRLVVQPYVYDMTRSKVIATFGISPKADVRFVSKQYRIDEGALLPYSEPILIDRACTVTLVSRFSDGTVLERAYPVTLTSSFNQLNYALEEPASGHTPAP